MLVGTQKRKKKNSTKVNLLISATFHGVIVIGLLYFAARNGLLGKQIKKIAVEMVREEKKPPPKPKEPEKPKEIVTKPDEPKVQDVAKIETPRAVAPPPPSSAAEATVAPPPAEAASFDFGGGREVESSSDPKQLYKLMLQNAIKLNWERPEDSDDHSNVAEVEISVDKTGRISSPVFEKKSGQKKWDDSVNLAIAKTTKMIRPPPTNFPSQVIVRFDVEALEPVGQ